MTRSKYNLQQKELANRNAVVRILKKNLHSILVISALLCAVFAFNVYAERSLGGYFDLILTRGYYYSSRPIHWFRSIVDNGKSFFVVMSHSQELHQENLILKQQLLELEIVKKQNNELKKAVHYIDHSNFKIVSAQVIASNTDIIGDKLVINAGSNDGVRDGDVVINASGMVGRVIDVSEYSSRILLITSNLLKIPVLLLKSGLHCIVGEADSDEMLKLVYKKNKEIVPRPGELAVTSGEDGKMPFGIKVGTIVKTTSNGMSLKPIIDPTQIYIVSVLLEEVEK